jgi:hypothetical protein
VGRWLFYFPFFYLKWRLAFVSVRYSTKGKGSSKSENTKKRRFAKNTCQKRFTKKTEGGGRASSCHFFSFGFCFCFRVVWPFLCVMSSKTTPNYLKINPASGVVFN